MSGTEYGLLDDKGTRRKILRILRNKMNKSERQKTDHAFLRFIILCIGLSVMAFGISFSIKAGLGTSPISSAPYVTSAISGLSVGVTTIIINFIMILLQPLILRKQFDLFQLLQFPATIVFGFMIDVAENVIKDITFSNYFEQWILCIIGIFLIALGISIQVETNFVTTAGEGLVLAICKVTHVKFSNMKIAFDSLLVAISVVLSFAFLGRLVGVREGTLAAAIFVGMTTKFTIKIVKWIHNLFSRNIIQTEIKQ